MFTQFSVGAFLVVGIVLGIAGWAFEPLPVTRLPSYIVAGIVAVGAGIGIPVALAATLTSRG